MQREQGTLADHPAQSVRRRKRHGAPSSFTVADVQLDALARLLAQFGETRPGRAAIGKRLAGDVAEGDEAETETEPAGLVATQQAVAFEGHGEAMQRRPRQPRRRLQVDQ